MKMWQCTLITLGLSLMFASMPPPEAKALDSIHDVYVMGNSLPGPVTAPPPPSPNCVSLAIGGTGQGTNYGAVILQSTDGSNAAQILAIEQNQNCYGMSSNATRDQLFVSNTNVIPTSSGVNTPLTIEYRADFDSGPDGQVVFGGFMKGTFKKKNAAGTYSPVTCFGSAPPNGPCVITYAPAVYSDFLKQEIPLSSLTSTNPYLGKFNVAIPAGSSIDMGNGLMRSYHVLVTITLPSTDHMVELSGGAIVEKLEAGPTP